MQISSPAKLIVTALLLAAATPILTGCSTTLGSPKLVQSAVKQVCLTNAELAALRRESKTKIAQNNDLTGKKC